MRYALVLAAVLSGCGGSGTVNGTVAGFSVFVRDAIFSVFTDQNTGKTVGMGLAMADKGGLCALFQAGRQPRSASMVVFGFVSKGQLELLAPDVGEYAVKDKVSLFNVFQAGREVSATFAKNDANCTNAVAASDREGASGTVTVTGVKGEKGGTLSGSFNVPFKNSSGTLTGTFNAEYCEIKRAFDPVALACETSSNDGG